MGDQHLTEFQKHLEQELEVAWPEFAKRYDGLRPFQRAAIEALTGHPVKPNPFFLTADMGVPDDASDHMVVKREPSFRPVMLVADAKLTGVSHNRRFGKSIAILAAAHSAAIEAELEKKSLELIAFDSLGPLTSDWFKPLAKKCFEPIDEAATPNPARRLAPAELHEIHRKRQAPRKGRRYGKLVRTH